MASVQEHYDRHLGPVYGWMIGDFEAARNAARAELQAAGVSDADGRLAVDLGAGTGAHAAALAGAGYAVTVFDTCALLLDELIVNCGDKAIRRVNDDLLNVKVHCKEALDVVLCMGDTLTHLASLESVERLFETISRILGPDGVFVATFRDYQSRVLEDAGRFIPVRQDDRRILTCFLEYGQTAVTVYDLLYERADSGWLFRVSSYSKLRLNPEWARSALERLGLTASLGRGPNGMVRLVAKRHG